MLFGENLVLRLIFGLNFPNFGKLTCRRHRGHSNRWGVNNFEIVTTLDCHCKNKVTVASQCLSANFKLASLSSWKVHFFIKWEDSFFLHRHAIGAPVARREVVRNISGRWSPFIIQVFLCSISSIISTYPKAPTR